MSTKCQQQGKSPQKEERQKENQDTQEGRRQKTLHSCVNGAVDGSTNQESNTGQQTKGVTSVQKLDIMPACAKMSSLHIQSMKSGKEPKDKVVFKMKGVNVKTIIDTGSSVNIVDQDTHKRLGKPKLREISSTLYPFRTSNQVEGVFTAEIVKREICSYRCISGKRAACMQHHI